MDIQENVAYTVLITGATLDQISTRIGLRFRDVYEVNPFARWLQSRGLWSVFDASFLLLLILQLYVILRVTKAREFNVLLLIPLIVGFVRLIIGVWNLQLL